MIAARAAIVLLALTSASVAIAHMACIWLGPECFQVQRAPLSIIESSKTGTWLATIATSFVSSLFLICSLYALSAGKFIKRLPLMNTAVYTISIICIARGLIIVPLIFRKPELLSNFDITASIIWFLYGVLLIYGYKTLRPKGHIKR